jgi:hypothetical protein
MQSYRVWQIKIQNRNSAAVSQGAVHFHQAPEKIPGLQMDLQFSVRLFIWNLYLSAN